MKTHLRFAAVALGLLASVAGAPQADAAIIMGWNVHNHTGAAPTVGGTAAAPTFTLADNAVLMAPFNPIALANDGDSIAVSTMLTLNGRTTTGVNSLNTQLRFGVFNGPAGAVAVNDVPNQGFIIEYTNAAAGGLIPEQQSAAQSNPFNRPVNIGNGSQDAGADSLQGANLGPVRFEITVTRVGGMINLSGSISGTDAVAGNSYLANYAVNAYSSATFPANGAFTFDRVGLFLGDNVNAASMDLTDSIVTTNVPEPIAPFLLTVGALFMGLKRRTYL